MITSLGYIHLHTSINVTTMMAHVNLLEINLDRMDRENKHYNNAIEKYTFNTQKEMDDHAAKQVQKSPLGMTNESVRVILTSAVSRRLKSATSRLTNIGMITATSTGQRDKRQLFAILAGAFGLATTFLGIHNTVKLSMLAGQVNTLSSNQDTILIAIKEHQTAINNMDEKMRAVIVALNIMEQVADNRAMTQAFLASIINLESALSLIEHQITATEEVIASITNSNRLHPSYITATASQELITQVAEAAKAIGYTSLATHPSHLFQTDASFLGEGGIIHIFTHVPTARQGDRLKVLRHVPFPILLLDTTLTTIRTAETVIAVSSDMKSYKTLTAEELAQCDKLGNTFLCKWQNSVSTDFQATCLSSLYKRDMPMVKQRCSIHMEPAADMIYQTSYNTFLLYSNTSTTGSMQYVNEVDKRPFSIVRGLNRITVPQGCMAYSPHHMFSSTEKTSLDSNYSLSYVWEFEEINIAETITTPEERQAIVAVNQKGKLPTDVHVLKAILANKTMSLTMANIAVIAAGTVGLCLFFYIVWRRIVTRRQENRLNYRLSTLEMDPLGRILRDRQTMADRHAEIASSRPIFRGQTARQISEPVQQEESLLGTHPNCVHQITGTYDDTCVRCLMGTSMETTSTRCPPSYTSPSAPRKHFAK